MAYTTINKPGLHFNTKLYTGNGGSQSITGVGFQPDWIWFKKRNGAADSSLIDAVRGVRKSLTSNNNEGQYTESAGLSAFDSDGFSFDGAGFDHVNTNNDTFAGWCWKAGGGQGSSNTDGSINTTYTSVNTTAGFSVSQYTGTGSETTVGHGLGVIPKIVFFKRLDSGANWVVQSPLMGNKVQLVLNDATAGNTDSRLGATDNWTNQVFTVGTYGDMNANGGTYVAYAFADIKGYSKFSTYEGNGSNDGQFVYTGFKPAFLITKRVDTGNDNWHMLDSARDIDNPAEKVLQTNEADAESTTSSSKVDFLSNGFKCRGTGASLNTSGLTYIYIAFAKEPLVGTNNVPATAR